MFEAQTVGFLMIGVPIQVSSVLLFFSSSKHKAFRRCSSGTLWCHNDYSAVINIKQDRGKQSPTCRSSPLGGASTLSGAYALAHYSLRRSSPVVVVVPDLREVDYLARNGGFTSGSKAKNTGARLFFHFRHFHMCGKCHTFPRCE